MTDRSGPFEAGERVQLTDPKGRLHTVTLEAGKYSYGSARIAKLRRSLTISGCTGSTRMTLPSTRAP